jgi:hypothetical protein
MPMKLKIINILKLLSLTYIAVISLSFIVSIALQLPSFREVGHLKEGCYWTDALVPYIQCRGLLLNDAIKYFLNFWMRIMYTGMFSILSPWLALYFLLYCSPIFYLFWYWIKGRHLTSLSSGTPQSGAP